MALANTVSANGDLPFEATSSFYKPLYPSNLSDYDDHKYYRQDSALHRALEKYITPSLTIVSLIGNALIFVVFSMRFYKTNLTAMLYQVLAVTDGLSVIIRVVYHEVAPAAISCEVIMFLLCWSRIVSGWLIVVITVARIIIVWFPHKSKQMNTKRKYSYIIGALSLVSGIFSAPLFATAGNDYDSDMDGQPRFCLFFRRDNVGKMEWYRLVFKVSIVTQALIRLLFVIIANGFIVYGIKKSRRDVNSSTAGSNDVDNRKNKNATIILWISSTSVLFSLPDVIYAIKSTYHNDPNSDAYFFLLVFLDFLPVFDCINRSINIIFFCVFGAEFRRRLKELLRAQCKITDISNSLTSSTRIWVCIF